ncbi:zinc-binding alcohol dehydrogenase family protein [Aspergillus affinis]|uniref:zinc-binding alcohol dehydrogenase family protein n=1 Tax=Aspergillus affinis TaxID=1070780 RepID=UPI0022FE66DD|nr:uncharacterized protein KD926_002342 [Aspergillus affinis]KAI9043963.1 hypothetical protein KD926_002342 [Aspergillus affinis]
MPTHLAAISPAKGQPFELQTRTTPKPGPDDLLIAVKSVALNPADAIMRDQGLFIPTYPTVLGFDMSGVVLEVGSNAPISTSDKDLTLSFRPGTRVAAYAALVWTSCDPDYGPFQERCLVPWQHAVPLPDESMSWNFAATLPVAVEVPLNAWDIMGIPRMAEISASAQLCAGSPGTNSINGEECKNTSAKREALLIWGASSSVGTMGVQTARLLREDPNSAFAAVYATAGSANKSYVAALGADRVFDYKDSHVVNAIVSAAKQDGLVIRHCFLATGQLALCQAVLKAFLEDGEDRKMKKKTAKIGSAPPVPLGAEVVDGVETIFVVPSAVEGERLEQFRYWIGTWLRENLIKGTIKPSPEPSVVGKGLEFINSGLDTLLRGVSCTKLVVEVAG